MATTTPNLGLTLPIGTEKVSRQIINDNMDIIDEAVNALQDGIAIVSNNNTHVAIASGQYVYVRNHDSLATGLYKATSAIAANATLSSSNLTADSAGGLNALNSSISSLSDHITSYLLGEYSTLSSLQAAISSLLQSRIGTDGTKLNEIVFKCSEAPFKNLWTNMHLYIGDSISFFMGEGVDSAGNSYTIRQWGGASTFNVYSLSDQIDSYRQANSVVPTLETGWTASDIAFRRIDRICIIYTRGLKCNSSGSGWVDVCTVPDGYSNYVIANGIISAETSDNYTAAEVRVAANKFQLYAPVANISYFGSLWYFRTLTGS